MLIRRIRQHVARQDWFAVSVDLVIVVLGVFIGIEVANWNERRQERAEERLYYAEIREDLRADLITLERARQLSFANDRQARLVLDALRGMNLPDAEPGSVAAAIHRGAFLYLPSTSRRTYDELISTGNLGLLRDSGLKRAIVDYHATFSDIRQWDALMRTQQAEYWSEVAGILPPDVLRAAVRGRTPQVSPAELDRILDRVRRRERADDLLGEMAVNQERIRRDCEMLERRTRALISAIDRKLGRQSTSDPGSVYSHSIVPGGFDV